MSRCILEVMTEAKKRLFTVPLSLEELAGIHAAVDVLGHKNATGVVYTFIRRKIDEAKAKSLSEYEQKFKVERTRVLTRSKQKAKEKQFGPRKLTKPVAAESQKAKDKDRA